ncbi:MAG TPA: universal stress protein [Gemmatimonadaceae bacterium]|jgi:nucleotide-binding universal stress UspA family protein|nr:universal stress protein [Gemmatimonadaceae bacterium]
MQRERVLVGIDFSPASLRALRWTALVFGADAELVIAHVVDEPVPPPVVAGEETSSDDVELLLLQAAEDRLQAISREMRLRRRVIEVCLGPVSEGLLTIADRAGVSLIVIGVRRDGEGILNHVGGSARRLLAQTRIPVLLAASPGSRLPSHILSGTDGSPISEDVDAWSRRLSNRFGSAWTRLAVIEATVPSTVTSDDAMTPSPTPGSPVSRGETGIDVHESVSVFGEAAPEILASAERYGTGLIVVGLRIADRARRLAFGSVTWDVLLRTRCPVLIVVGRAAAAMSADDSATMGDVI